MRNAFLAMILALVAVPMSAKAKPASQPATFLGTTNVDCLTVRKSTMAILYDIGTSYRGIPTPIPIPIGAIFPDTRKFSAIKVYQIQVGEKTMDTIPNTKNPLALIAPNDPINVIVTDTDLYVLTVKNGKTKKYKFLVLRTK